MEELTQVEQSTVLSEAEVASTLAGEAPAEGTQLPSDEAAFEMPEKFAGKSAEEIAKSYLELEKFKAKDSTPEPVEEGGDPLSEEPEVSEPTPVEQEQYNKYAESYDANGGLSEAEYSELAKAGYTKDVVDAEIARRTEVQEFETYKQEKALSDVLNPLGGGTEKFKEVSDWANQNKSVDELTAFNEALAGAPKLAQQALLKGLYAEYDKGTAGDTVLHTNTSQVAPSKGYATETEFFADMSNPAYKTDPSYVKAVEAKLAKTNTQEWSF